ncbi:MAG: hypothetical protein HUU50_12845 [Candidatus Brocadiae bacterium]|nr:hypothetical protein [Candidatus Brocadiia bacterium]
MAGYPLDRLYEEVAFLAYHFHWDHSTILNMEHHERQKWCAEISKINEKLNEDKENAGTKTKSLLEMV